MKIATAAYPLDTHTSWASYAQKITAWVREAAAAGADLLVFPEYGAMELATLAGLDIAGDLERSLWAVAERMDPADELHAALAKGHGVHILAASGPAIHPDISRPVNRARLFSPTGDMGVQDKQMMTRFEAETWNVAPGGALQLFDTKLGKIGVLICYDCEFPTLGRALADADILLAPSATEARAGYSRVRIGAQARALENQCVVAMSSLVGAANWSPAVDVSTGAGGIYGPPDTGFPSDGVLAQGTLNAPGWTYADVDLQSVAEVRANGAVLNRRDRPQSAARSNAVTVTRLR